MEIRFLKGCRAYKILSIGFPKRPTTYHLESGVVAHKNKVVDFGHKCWRAIVYAFYRLEMGKATVLWAGVHEKTYFDKVFGKACINKAMEMETITSGTRKLSPIVREEDLRRRFDQEKEECNEDDKYAAAADLPADLPEGKPECSETEHDCADSGQDVV